MTSTTRTTWPRHLTAILLLEVLAVFVWWLYAFQPFEGLAPNAFGDSYDYAQIGRNILRGGWLQGITTYQIPPLALSVSDRVPFLNVIRAPLHPTGLALAFAIFGPWDRSIAVYGGALFLLSIPFLYLLGLRVFGGTVALVTSLVYILSGWVLEMSVSGLSEPLYIVLFLATLLLAYESAQKPDSKILPVGAGALAGLAYLARYNTILFVPLVAIYLYLANRQRRWLRSGLFVACWGIVVAPWLIRNLVYLGQPLFSMQKWAMIMATPTYPRFSLWKYAVHPSVTGFFVDHWPEMATKVRDTFMSFYLHAPGDKSITGGNPFTFILFVASLFHKLARPQANFRLLVCTMLVMQVLSLLTLRYIPRLLFPFYPLFLLFGLELLIYWVKKWSSRLGSVRKRRWAQFLGMVVAVVLLSLPTLLGLPDAMGQGFYPQLRPVANLQKYGPAMYYLQTHTEKDAILVSDAMDIVSWYGDRASIWTPIELEMVQQIEARVPVEGIYLTDRMLAWPEDEVWHDIYRSQPETILGGRYHLEKVFGDGSLFYRQTR